VWWPFTKLEMPITSTRNLILLCINFYLLIAKITDVDTIMQSSLNPLTELIKQYFYSLIKTKNL
jgi:hypothetical protein